MESIYIANVRYLLWNIYLTIVDMPLTLHYKHLRTDTKLARAFSYIHVIYIYILYILSSGNIPNVETTSRQITTFNQRRRCFNSHFSEYKRKLHKSVIRSSERVWCREICFKTIRVLKVSSQAKDVLFLSFIIYILKRFI